VAFPVARTRARHAPSRTIPRAAIATRRRRHPPPPSDPGVLDARRTQIRHAEPPPRLCGEFKCGAHPKSPHKPSPHFRGELRWGARSKSPRRAVAGLPWRVAVGARPKSPRRAVTAFPWRVAARGGSKLPRKSSLRIRGEFARRVPWVPARGGFRAYLWGWGWGYSLVMVKVGVAPRSGSPLRPERRPQPAGPPAARLLLRLFGRSLCLRLLFHPRLLRLGGCGGWPVRLFVICWR
jgi:hypothetical protein